MKVIFMGTPEFACPTLQTLIDHNDYEVVAVYTQPPRPTGRGHKVQPSPIHLLAQQYNIPVEHPVSLRKAEVQAHLVTYQPDLIVVVAYGLILPKAVLEIPKWGCINIHGSILPRWRGAAPIHRALLAGDKQTGITIMKMDEGLDTGPMLSTKVIEIEPGAIIQDLHDMMARLGAECLMSALPDYLNGTLTPQTQPEQGVTYADKITKEEGHLDWSEPAEILECKVRALNPWPGTWFQHSGNRIRVHKAKILQGHNAKDAYGRIIKEPLVVQCGQDALEILQLQRPGGKILAVEEFLNGYPLHIGENLLVHDNT